MSNLPHKPQMRFDATDDRVVDYCAVSASAVVGLAIGLLSSITVVSAGFWFIPLIGLAVNAGALWRIRRRAPALVGRPAAIGGLLLSSLFTAFVPAQGYFYRGHIADEARQVSMAWFECVAHKDAANAHRWTIDPHMARGPVGVRDEFYRANPKAAAFLQQFVDKPIVRTLFALGSAAHIRYYESGEMSNAESFDDVQQIYTVTYGDAGKKTTFFVLLRLGRVALPEKKAEWFIEQIEGPIRPSGWSE